MYVSLLIPVVKIDYFQDNILVSNTGAPLIADFGSAHLAQMAGLVSATANHCGTTRYMAIELIRGDESLPTKSSDVWAFGMLIYVRKVPTLCV